MAGAKAQAEIGWSESSTATVGIHILNYIGEPMSAREIDGVAQASGIAADSTAAKPWDVMRIMLCREANRKEGVVTKWGSSPALFGLRKWQG
mmetsp:Transcript_5372/g.17953  ORF Transcript_5372/g.17953 Transcript_5372/m.17953 type:complete len:92 (+) Transcript_5372:176-451(+)